MIPQVRRALAGRDLPVLNELVPKRVRWRMIPDLLEHIAFLDIETTGLSPFYNYVTCIGVYDGTKVHMFVWGQNLDDFPDFIAQFPAIATFNGACFDVPFLEHNLGLSLPHVHFDLRFLLKRLGLSGGLKKVEHSFGLDRGEVAGINGFTAVLLWRRYKKTGDERYLNTMLAYNVEDVVNLEVLLHQAYNGLVKQESLPFDALPIPEKNVTRPYVADPVAVQEILSGGSIYNHV